MDKEGEKMPFLTYHGSKSMAKFNISAKTINLALNL